MSKGVAGFGKHLAIVGITLAVTIAFLLYVLFQSGTIPTFGSSYKVDAIVPQAATLTPGARVVVAGADVGSVSDVTRADSTGGNAQLSLNITDDEVTPLPEDSTVEIRTRSQVGENYVAINIGNQPETIPDGGTLDIDSATEHVDVDQILSILKGKTQDRTRALFQEFGSALTERGGDLNRTISGANSLFQNGTHFMDVVYPDRELTGQLVDQLGRVTASLGERDAAIEAIANQGVTALRAIADRDASLSATLQELPSTLESVKNASNTVGDTSAVATPVVLNLAAATRDLRPAVRDLVPSAGAARGLMYELDGAAPQLTGTLNSLKNLSTTLPDALKPTETTFCELDPALRYIEPRIQELFQIITHLGSGANSYDSLGHMVRLMPVLNQRSLSGTPPEVQSASHALLESGLFGQTTLENYNPFPAIGTLATSVATSGEPNSPEAMADGPYKYPRVEADC